MTQEKAPSRHEHDFHGLWWTFGEFRRQDVHMHPCDARSCGVEMVGLGLNCDGQWDTHRPKKLTSSSRWPERGHEGDPL